jgi:hypothetical protein
MKIYQPRRRCRIYACQEELEKLEDRMSRLYLGIACWASVITFTDIPLLSGSLPAPAPASAAQRERDQRPRDEEARDKSKDEEERRAREAERRAEEAKERREREDKNAERGREAERREHSKDPCNIDPELPQCK